MISNKILISATLTELEIYLVHTRNVSVMNISRKFMTNRISVP